MLQTCVQAKCVFLQRPLFSQSLAKKLSDLLGGRKIHIWKFIHSRKANILDAAPLILVNKFSYAAYLPSLHSEVFENGISGWGERGPNIFEALHQLVSNGYVWLCTAMYGLFYCKASHMHKRWQIFEKVYSYLEKIFGAVRDTSLCEGVWVIFMHWKFIKKEIFFFADGI